MDVLGIGLAGKSLSDFERKILRDETPYAVVLFGRADLGSTALQGLGQDGLRTHRGSQPVKALLARSPDLDEACLFELRKLRRNLALPLGHDLLQLRHRKLFVLQQQQQP